MTHKLFVYGTLRRGQGNYRRLLTEAKFLRQTQTAPEFTMRDCGCPVVYPNGTTAITGDIFEVTDEQLVPIDQLEGHPRHYIRTMITLPDGENVEIYLQDEHSRLSSNNIIPEGDWVKWCESGHGNRFWDFDEVDLWDYFKTRYDFS